MSRSRLDEEDCFLYIRKETGHKKSDSGEAKRVVERVRSTKPSRFLISNITIRSSNFCYHKIFLKEVYTVDRFTLVFLSVYIFQPSIVRMQKVRLLTN